MLKESEYAEFLTKTYREADSVKITFLTFEKYYLRNSSYTALSILITESQDMQYADIIGFGGGAGIMNISWGSNKKLAKKTSDIFVEYGFEIEDVIESSNI